MSIFTERVRYKSADFEIQGVDTHGSEWDSRVDEIRKGLGAPNNPLLFPPHFLKATFPKIGGEAVSLIQGDKLVGAIFLFPQNGNKYIGRLHLAHGAEQLVDKMSAGFEIRQALEDVGLDVTLYNPNEPHLYVMAIHGVKPARCVVLFRISFAPRPGDGCLNLYKEFAQRRSVVNTQVLLQRRCNNLYRLACQTYRGGNLHLNDRQNISCRMKAGWP